MPDDPRDPPTPPGGPGTGGEGGRVARAPNPEIEGRIAELERLVADCQERIAALKRRL